MDSILRNVIRFVLSGTVLLVLAGIVFLAGFGSAYLLTGSGVLVLRESHPISHFEIVSRSISAMCIFA